MAPRRIVKVSSPEKRIQAASEKLAGKRQKRSNPLKVPSIITISIPSKEASIDVPDNQKRLDVSTKIALANQVVRLQLSKEQTEIKPELTPAPKKRGRKKKIVSEHVNETDTDTTNKEAKVTPAKPAASKKSTVKKKDLTRKRVADSTVVKPKLKRQKLIPKAIEEKSTENDDAQNVGSKVDTTAGKVRDVPPNIDANVFNPPKESPLTRRKALNRGKQDSRPMSPILQTRCTRRVKTQASAANSPKQPAIESPKPEVACPKPTKKETDMLDVNNAGLVESRKTSISSNSNLSWTRDISSSSATTCITVTSNDFVRFNKRFPVIKLTNIDSEVDKYKNSLIADDSSSSSDNSSSSDSESVSSNDQSKSDNRSLLSYDSPEKDKSLYLSSSSRNSIVTQNENRDFNGESDFNKNDYRQATHNLLQALKKIDIEFRNWLPEGVVASDLNCIKDKLFDIMSSEFRALTHCRNLQEISKLEVVNSADVHEEVDDIQEPDVESVNVSVVSNKSNILGRDKVESTKCNILENKKINTIDSNENSVIESNKNNTVKYNKVVSNKTVDRNVIGSRNINTDCSEIESHKEKTAEPNKVERNKFYMTGHNSIETSKTNIVEQNKVANNKFRFNNIRIEFNRTGAKKVTNPVEANAFESKHVESKNPNVVESKSEEELTKPSTSGLVSNRDDESRSPQFSESNDSSSEDFAQDRDVNSFPDSPCDDDDALSLFAESITGIESSKFNTSTVSPAEKPLEEYVPKPIQNNIMPQKNYTYCPTKISEQNKNGVVKIVCEKQNADSTSICKDKKVDTKPPNSDSVETNQEFNDNLPPNTRPEVNTPKNVNKTGLLADLYKLKFYDRHLIFKGFCYRNLLNSCQPSITPCRYPHYIPDKSFVQSRLSRMTEEYFVKEYMLIRKTLHLMRLYGMCFVEECVKRRLTRMLVEIAYDFISISFYLDNALILEVVEINLLYLNNVDLSECEDLLQLKYNNSLVCDIFMRIMSCTQNFSRFKPVFLSLTYFMVNNDRTFELLVAQQILERVCILPFDEPMIRAFIQILRLTNPEIFFNSNIALFENLIRVNENVLEEYLSVKREIHMESSARHIANEQPMQLVDEVPKTHAVDQPTFSPVERSVPPPLMKLSVEKPLIVRPEMREGVPLPPSPDTTHLDLMNKTAEDIMVPKITRTFWGANSTLKSNNMTASSSNNEDRYKWRNRSIFQQINRGGFSSPRHTMRPPLRPRPPIGLMKNRQYNHRLVTFGRSPIMYPPPGPEF